MKAPLRNLLLLIIVVCGLALRFIHLSSNPPGFFADEAVIGLDAYSLLHTGYDHTGHRLGFLVEALGDWRGFVPIVSAMPSVVLFGLNEASTRMPSVVYGTLSILLMYAITAVVFDPVTGLLAAALLAISPWHIHMSRMGFEFMSFPAWVMIGLLLFLYGLKKSLLLPLAGIAMGIAIYTYAPARLFVPLFVLFLFLLYRTTLLRRTHVAASITGGMFFMIFVIPLGVAIIRGTATARLQVISIQSSKSAPAQKLLHVARTYGNYFSPQFLFITGDIDFPGQFITRHSIRGIGLLYLVALPFLAIGLARMLKNLRTKRNGVLFVWLLLYPVGGALTVNENPFATRGIIGVIPFQILTAAGIVYIVSWVAKTWRRLLLPSIVATLLGLLFSLGLFIQKWQQYPLYAADFWGWQFGPRQIMANFLAHKDNFDELYIAGNFNAPEIFLRFYDPENTCQSKCMIGDAKRINLTKRQLFAIGADRMKEFPIQEFTVIDTIAYPNGDAAFYIGTFHTKNTALL